MPTSPSKFATSRGQCPPGQATAHSLAPRIASPSPRDRNGSLGLAGYTAPKQNAIAITAEIDPIDNQEQGFTPARLKLGPEGQGGAQDHEFFNQCHSAAMMLGIPVRNGADKPIVTEGQKVPMGIVVMHGQVTEAVQQHAGTPQGDRRSLPPTRQHQRDRREGNGMKEVIPGLPTRLPVSLSPNLRFGLTANQFGPAIHQEHGHIWQDRADRDRHRHSGIQRQQKSQIQDSVTGSVHG